ncbi:MAG: hypothetical protein HONBIEJF_00047 [Fimbriimonadaceae bacterium]|nr:hypothetical protein [Fimbriimonadaceae bacterium]
MDELLTAAFEGETAGVSSEVTRLRAVKSDLLRLKTELPECQLSTERMRDAILNAGIKPKRSYWNWLAPASAVTACLAFVMIFRSGSESVRGAEDIAKAVPPIFEKPVSDTADSNPSTPSIAKSSSKPIEEIVVASKSSPKPKAAVKRVAVRDKSADANSERKSGTSSSMALAQTTPKAESTEAATDTMVATTALGPWDKAEEPGVIVIDTQEDLNTGANRASEVATPSNVVISG